MLSKKEIIFIFIILIEIIIIIRFLILVIYEYKPFFNYKNLDTIKKIERGNCYIPYRQRPDKPYHYDLQPNDRTIFTGCNIKLNETLIYTNSFGFRDKEINTKKDNNTIRIVFLGDSQTFGWGVEYGERFSEILIKLLNEKYNNYKIKFEGINMGIPGYEAKQKVEIFIDRDIEFNPDVIIFQYEDADKFSYELKKSIESLIRKNIEKKCKDININKLDCEILISTETDKEMLKMVSNNETFLKLLIRENVINPLANLSKIFNGTIFLFSTPPSIDHYTEDELKKVEKETKNLIILWDLKEYWRPRITFKIDAHLNEEGHKLIARFLFNKTLNFFDKLTQQYIKNLGS